jgi:O-antigen/teichoic acid export membrane protein
MDSADLEPTYRETSAQRGTSPVRLLKNAFFNSGAWGVNAILTLLTTPFIVYKLTVEGYGIYVLLTGLIGYYNLMDLGIGQGVTKYVAEYYAKQDHNSIAESINGALLVQLLTGVLASLGLFVLAAPILSLIRVSPEFWTDATLSLFASAIGFFFTMVANTLSSALMGLQRYGLTSMVGGLTNTILTLLIVVGLGFGAGLKEITSLTAASGIVMSFVYVMLLRRLLPDWRISAKVNWSLLLQLFRFSAYLLVSRISNLFSNYIVRFVVGVFLGPAMVTYYVVPAKLIGAVGSLLGGAFVVLFPFASELGSKRDQAKIQELFLGGSRLFAAVSIPLFLALYVAARPILTVWMGPEFAEEGWAMLGLLSLASLCGALTTVPNLVTMGLGYSRVIGAYSLLNVLMYAICLPLFTDRWGVEGTAWAMLLVALPSFGLIAYQTKYLIHLPLRKYLHDVLYFHVIPLIVSVWLGLLIAKVVYTSAIVASLVPVIYCGIYFGLMMVVGVIPLQELMNRIKGKGAAPTQAN